jgi:uncharacterized protein with FMN-binding domain
VGACHRNPVVTAQSANVGAVSSTTSTTISNAVHLAQLLKDAPYPAA